MTDWFNYIIFDKVKTYVGSTVNLNRRIRQHNGEIKGGAKYTRGGSWQYYCVIFNLNNHKNTCLSEEWHIKWMTNKVKKAKSTKERRKLALEQYYATRDNNIAPYTYIIFVSRQYLEHMPKMPSNTYTFITDDFSMENIQTSVTSLCKLVQHNSTIYKYRV